MTGVGDIARHFVLKAAYVLVAWGVTRVVDLARKRLRGRARRGAAAPAEQQAGPEARPAPKAAPRRPYRIYRGPEFQPSNPGWLREAVALEPAQLATDLSWQCPALVQFQAKVAGHPGPGPALAVAFGRAARKQLFALEPETTYLNHGSYGAAFRLSLEVQQWYREQLEAQPVRFMETTAVKGMVAAVADAARFIGAAPSDVVPVPNATTAVSAVLAAVGLRRGDWVLTLNTTYPAVKSAVARVAAAAGASVIEVQLGLEEMQRPASVEAAVQAALSAGSRRVRLAVLDHLVSFPPLLLPVAALAAACKAVGARVLVDGAHAIGNVPGLQVPSLGADYYTTNLHKWGCSPKGAALLWAAPERQAGLLPLVTSHGCGLGFRGEFLWQGTADPSAWLAVPAALAVLRALGPQRVAAHNARLVAEAAAALVLRWGGGGGGVEGGTNRQAGGGGGGGGGGGARAEGPARPELLVLGGGGDWEEGGGAAGMLVVQLPPLQGYGCTAEDAVRLQRWLRYDKSIEVPVVFALERLWVRLSAQIYNEAADYQQLGAAVAGLQRQQQQQQ